MPIERIIEAESIAEGSFKADTTPANANANKNSGNNREDSFMTSNKGRGGGANKGPYLKNVYIIFGPLWDFGPPPNY